MSTINLQKAINRAAKHTNLNEPVTGAGGGYTPPAKGVPGLRFVGYVEVGPQEKKFQGTVQVKPQAHLVFELHGKKWPVSENGVPQRMTVKLTCPAPGKAPHVKSGYYKLFVAMNWENKYRSFPEMLGQEFVGTVYHRQDSKDEKKFYAQFNDPVIGGAPNIRAPLVEDEDGEPRRRNVPEAISEPRLFMWDDPDMDQWQSIFIDGEYDDGKSKNVFQNLIKSSPGFSGSPAEAMLMGLGGDDDDVDDVAATKAEAKARKAKAEAPVEEEEDDEPSGTPSEGGPDEPAETPAPVQGKTRRPKNADVSRAHTTKKAHAKAAEPQPASEDDDDEDDPLAF